MHFRTTSATPVGPGKPGRGSRPPREPIGVALVFSGGAMSTAVRLAFVPSHSIPNVGEIIDKFLIHKQRAVERETCAESTLRDYRYYLDGFRQSLGQRLITECTGADLTEWLDSHSGWKSANTVKGALARIQA